MAIKNDNKIILTKGVANRIGVGKITIMKYVKQGKLPKPFKYGSNNAWDLQDIEDFIEDREKQESLIIRE